MRVILIVTAALTMCAKSSTTATAQDLVPHPKWYVSLTDISRSDKGTRANLYDRQNARTIPLSTNNGEDHFVIRDIEGGTRLQSTVVHIGGRDVVFQSEGKNYAIHIGQRLGTALVTPLSVDEVTALKQDTPSQPAAKTFSLDMRDKPWGSVFEWLTDQTGMRVAANVFPPGSFTFISPTNKTYSLAEIVDVMNDVLTQQGFILIRRDQEFTVVPVTDPIDAAILPRVKLDDLGQRGTNELVTVVVPLGETDSGDTIAEIRGLMGPFGNVTTLSRTNELLLQDTAGNLKRVVEMIKELEAKRPSKTADKSWSLELRSRTWPEVFGWLTEQTGFPVVGQAKPAGTFTFVSADNKTYSLPEIIDVLNDGLLVQKLLLIRRGHSFALVPSDESVDPALIPRVNLSELRARGNSELVSVVLPVTTLSADDVAMEAERVLGPLGRAVPLAKANQVILQDSAGNIKRFIDAVRAMEEKAPRRR